MLTGIAHSRSIPVSYSLTANISNGSSLNEGDSITYTLTTTGLPNGTTVYWSNTGSTGAADFTQGINSGTLTINNNTASITLTLYEDYVTEGTETIVFNVMETQGGSVEDTMTHNVNDTTITPGVFRVTVGSTGILCHGALTGELRVDSATGGNPPYTYTFKQGSQVLQTGSATTLSGLAAGTYTIDVTDTSAGQYAAQTISQNEVILQPSSSISSTHSSTTSSITIDPAGGTAGYTIYLFHYSGSPYAQQTTSGSAVTFTGLPSNTGFKYSIADSAGCSIPNRISVSTSAVALSASISKTNVTCASGADGQIIVNVSSGEGDYEYAWNGMSAEGSTAYNLTQGTYSVTVTDGAGQQQTFSEIQITQPDSIGLVLDSKTSTSIKIEATGGNRNYTYSGAGQTNSDGIFTGLTPGQSYSFSVNDSNGCSASTDLSVTTYDSIDADVVTSFSGCHGDAVGTATVVNQTGGSGEYTYEWSQNTNNYTSNVSISGLVADNYGVKIIDVNDTSNYKNIGFTITEPSALNSSFSASHNSATVIISGGTPEYEYIGSESYTQNGGTFNFTGLSGGTSYTFNFQDFHGCSESATGTTDWPPIVFTEFRTLVDQTCFHHPDIMTGYGQIKVSWAGGDGAINSLRLYRNTINSWTHHNGQPYTSTAVSGNTHTFTGLPYGWYQIGYNDRNLTYGLNDLGLSDAEIQQPTNWFPNVNGWEQAVTVYISEDRVGGYPNFTVNLYSNGSLIGSQTLTAKYGGQNGVGSVEQWVNNNPGMIAYFENLDPTETYNVVVTDSTGCVFDTGTLSGSQAPNPPELDQVVINMGGDTCWDSGNVGSFYVQAGGGIAPLSMQIYRNGSTYGATRSPGLVQNLPEGTYYVKVTDAVSQSVNSNTVTYSRKSEPTLNVSSVSSNSIVVNVDPGAVLHVNGGTIQTTSTPWTIGSLEPNTTYNITSTYDSCTSSPVPATTSCDSISITFSTSQISCNGGTGSIYTQVNGQTNPSGYTYQWYKNGSMMNDRTSYFLSGSDIGSGDYYVIVSSSCDSEQSSTVTLVDPPPLSVVQTGSTTNSITLQVSGGTPPYWVTMNSNTQTVNSSGQSITFNGLDEQVDSYYWSVWAGGCEISDFADKPTIELYNAWTTTVLSNYQPYGASTFCEITQSANANIYVQVISTNPYHLIGDYLRSSNGTPQTGFAQGDKIAMSYTEASAVPQDGGVYELTFGFGGEIVNVATIFCGGSGTNNGDDPPIFREDPVA